RGGNPHRVTARTALTALCASVVFLAGPAEALAASAWQRPVEVGGTAVKSPRVAIDAAGDAVAVWEDHASDQQTVKSATRAPDGTWSPPRELGIGIEPAVALDPSGRAVVVWAGSRGIEAAVEAAGGAWSKRAVVSPEVFAFGPEVALDDVGEATAIWHGPDPRHSIVQVATLKPGQSWSAGRELSARGRNAVAPQIAVDPAGAAVAVWRRRDGRRSIVEAAVRTAAGAWSRPAALSATGENAVAPQVAIDATGEAVAIWKRFDGAHSIVQSASRAAGAAWSRPVNLSAPGRNAEEPDVAIDAAGEAVAVWERFDGRFDRIQSASRRPGGSWSKATYLSRRGRSAHEPQVAVDAGGESVAVWERTTGGGAQVQAVSRPAGGVWSGPTGLGPSSGGFGELDVGISDGGEALAVWGGSQLSAATRPAP
ncbi:MAG TPA: hypothetical protein VIJ21_03300, partial [Solirubrobacterales bacterium]